MEVVSLDITFADINSAIDLSLKNGFVDNLRDRNELVKFDSKIRGYLGEIALRRWFRENGIIFQNSVYKNDSGSLDIDLLYLNSKNEELIIEVKTSLIPDIWRNLRNTLENADIKIIKRETQVMDTHGDFHVQIYFNFLTNERDRYIESLNLDLNSCTREELIEKMRLKSYCQAFVSWVDKKTLSKYLSGQVVKTWSFGYRNFWRCPIKSVGRPPREIIDCIKSYTK